MIKNIEQVKESDIIKIVSVIDEKIKYIKEQSNKKIKELNSIKDVFQDFCPHAHIEYIPDPSGNNDSYFVCQTCGLEKKKFT